MPRPFLSSQPLSQGTDAFNSLHQNRLGDPAVFEETVSNAVPIYIESDDLILIVDCGSCCGTYAVRIVDVDAMEAWKRFEALAKTLPPGHPRRDEQNQRLESQTCARCLGKTLRLLRTLVLLLEDHDDARSYLGVFLRYLGANVVLARNALRGPTAV